MYMLLRLRLLPLIFIVFKGGLAAALPCPEPPQTYLTIAEAEGIAIANNQTLQQAKLASQRDYWIYREVLGRYLPSARFDSIWNWSNQLPDTSVFLGDTVATQSRTFSIDQLLFSLPTYFEINSAHWFQISSFFQFAEEFVQTLARIRIAHYRVVLYRQLLAIQQELVDLFKESYLVEEIKLGVGETTLFEYNRNKLAYQNTLAEYYRTADNLELAKDQWVRELGICPQPGLGYDVRENEIPLEEIDFIHTLKSRAAEKNGQIKTALFTACELEVWDHLALYYSPSIRKFRAELKSANSRVKGAMGAYFPEVRAFGSQTTQHPPEFFGTKKRFTEGGINLSWTLFDGFSRESRIKRFQKERAIVRSQEVQNWINIQLEIRDQSQVFQGALYSLLSSEVAAKLAEDGIAMGEELFALGDITAIDYRDMIQAAGRANIELAQSQFSLVASYFELLATVGLRNPQAGALLLKAAAIDHAFTGCAP